MNNTIVEENIFNPIKGLVAERNAISPPPLRVTFDDLDQLVPRSICGSATKFYKEKYKFFSFKNKYILKI